MRFHQSTTFEADELLHLLSAWRLSEPRRLFAYPTLSRLELLLSSRVWNLGADVAIWRDEFRQLVGFALLWSRSRETLSQALEGPFTDPTLPADERILLEDAIVDWAKQRVQTMGAREGAFGTLHATVVQGSDRELAALERWKFQCSLTSANVYFTRQLASIPEGTLPDGFSIRPLSDERELPAYNALYGFNAVAHEHQLALLRSSEYTHLVATASDGTLVAYCEVSVCSREWLPGVPRIGWVDYIGTGEEYRQRGLGHALLLAGLEQLRVWGAEQACLITMPTNEAANALYGATGFTRSAYEDAYVWSAVN